MKRQELENRLIDFAVMIAKLIQLLPESKFVNHLIGQLIRSGTSPALNYGEAQSGESRNDFIHKLRIVLKELRESHVNLRIIQKLNVIQNEPILLLATNECNELISIFVKSIDTTLKNKDS